LRVRPKTFPKTVAVSSRRSARLETIETTPVHVSTAHKIADIVENAGLAAFGEAERAPYLHFLSHDPCKSYTEPIDRYVSRGERPSPEKRRVLHADGFAVTVNPSKELVNGHAATSRPPASTLRCARSTFRSSTWSHRAPSR